MECYVYRAAAHGHLYAADPCKSSSPDNSYGCTSASSDALLGESSAAVSGAVQCRDTYNDMRESSGEARTVTGGKLIVRLCRGVSKGVISQRTY